MVVPPVMEPNSTRFMVIVREWIKLINLSKFVELSMFMFGAQLIGLDKLKCNYYYLMRFFASWPSNPKNHRPCLGALHHGLELEFADWGLRLVVKLQWLVVLWFLQ